MSLTKEKAVQWLAKTRGLDAEGIVNKTDQSAVATLGNIYRALTGSTADKVLEVLETPDSDGMKQERISSAVSHCEHVKSRHLSTADVGFFATDEVVASMTHGEAQTFFRNQYATSYCESKGDVVAAFGVDNNIAKLRCRDALQFALKPRVSADEYAKITALIKSGNEEDPELAAVYDYCEQRYVDSPILDSELDDAVEAALNDPSDGAWKLLFLAGFVDFAVIEEEDK